MTTTFERGGEPEIDEALGRLEGDHALTDGQDIGVVVLAGELGRLLAPGDGTADTLHLVGGDGLAVA